MPIYHTKLIASNDYKYKNDKKINTNLFNDNSYFLNKKIIKECSENVNLIKRYCNLEAIKYSAILNQWLNEGKDYKNLKEKVLSIIKANKYNNEDIIKKYKYLLQTCEDIIKIITDNSTVIYSQIFITNVKAGSEMLLGSIILLITDFISHKLINCNIENKEKPYIYNKINVIIKSIDSISTRIDNEDLSDKYIFSSQILKDSIGIDDNK